MTAASGVVHEEFHSEHFTREGGTFEMAQLWVNLPRDKNAPAGYQALLERDIPRVVAGWRGSGACHRRTYEDTRTAHTFTPMDVWDVRMRGGRPPGRTFRTIVPPRSSCCGERRGHWPRHVADGEGVL